MESDRYLEDIHLKLLHNIDFKYNHIIVVWIIKLEYQSMDLDPYTLRILDKNIYSINGRFILIFQYFQLINLYILNFS